MGMNWITKIFNRLGAPAGASMSADIAAVKGDTSTSLTDIVQLLRMSQIEVATVSNFSARTTTSFSFTFDSLFESASFDNSWVMMALYQVAGSSNPGQVRALATVTNVGADYTVTLLTALTAVPAIGTKVWFTHLQNPAADLIALMNNVASVKTDTGTTLPALVAVTKSGKLQMKVTTCNLFNGAGSYDLATCATQAVVIDSIIFSCRLDLSADAGAITGISVQDNDTTPHILISQANGVKANLTAYAQLAWTGAIKVRVGQKLQVTIYGGTATANPTTCDVEITYHAVADGGTL